MHRTTPSTLKTLAPSAATPSPGLRPPSPQGRGRDPRIRGLTSRLQADVSRHSGNGIARNVCLSHTPPLIVLTLLVGEGGAKRRVRVNRVFRCHKCPISRSRP